MSVAIAPATDCLGIPQIPRRRKSLHQRGHSLSIGAELGGLPLKLAGKTVELLRFSLKAPARARRGVPASAGANMVRWRPSFGHVHLVNPRAKDAGPERAVETDHQSGTVLTQGVVDHGNTGQDVVGGAGKGVIVVGAHQGSEVVHGQGSRRGH